MGAFHLADVAAAAAAAEPQVQDPFLAVCLKAWSAWGSGVLAAVFHQTLGYWVAMEVLPCFPLAAPPSACWPSSSLTSGPAGAGAAAAAAGASA